MRCYNAAMLLALIGPWRILIITAILVILLWNRWPPSFPPRFRP
jgi:hypothetical protein